MRNRISCCLSLGIPGFLPSCVLVAFLLLFGPKIIPSSHARDLPLPPNLEAIEHYGCALAQFGPSGSVVWQGTGWAQHSGSAEHDWSVVVSRRDGRHARLAAMKDCDRWLDRSPSRSEEHTAELQ